MKSNQPERWGNLAAMAFIAIAGLMLNSCCCCPPGSPPDQPQRPTLGQAYYFSNGRGDTPSAPAQGKGNNDNGKTQQGNSDSSGSHRGPKGTGGSFIVSAKNPLPVPLVIQEGDYSCWSTCAEMIMRFHGVTVRQCAQANYVWGTAAISCCDAAGNLENTPDCDNAWSPDFPHWGFSVTHEPPTGPPPFGTPLAYH
ncbi:MAG TPA: hypothetical protein VI282_07200, partial [Verrucomicrobiae bacterium]